MPPGGEAGGEYEEDVRGERGAVGLGAHLETHRRTLGDWRGATLSRMRKLIKDADPDVVEEWKWMNPIWSHDGIICTGESYKKAVKLTFAKGALLKDPARLFNSSLEGNVRRAIDIHEGEEVTRPRSRRSFARRSPSIVPATSKAKTKKKAKS